MSLHRFRVIDFENVNEKAPKRVKENKQKQAVTNITDIVKDLGTRANKENIKIKFKEGTKEPKDTQGCRVNKTPREAQLPEDLKRNYQNLSILEELLGPEKEIDPFYPDKNLKVIQRQPRKRVVQIYQSCIQEKENNNLRHQQWRAEKYKTTSSVNNFEHLDLANISENINYGQIKEDFYFGRNCKLEAPKLVDSDSNKHKPVKHVKINSDKEDGPTSKKYKSCPKRKSPSLVLKIAPKRRLKKRRTIMTTLNLSRFRRKKRSDSSSYSSLIRLVLRRNRRESQTSRSSKRSLRASDDIQVLYARQASPYSSSSSRRHQPPQASDNKDIFGIRKSNLSHTPTVGYEFSRSRCKPYRPCKNNFKLIDFPSSTTYKRKVPKLKPCERVAVRQRRKPSKTVCKCLTDNVICTCEQGDVTCDCNLKEKISCMCSVGPQVICKCTSPGKISIVTRKKDKYHRWCNRLKCMRRTRDKNLCTCNSGNITCECSLTPGVVCQCRKYSGGGDKKDQVTSIYKLSQPSLPGDGSSEKVRSMCRWLADNRGSGDACRAKVDCCTSALTVPSFFCRCKSYCKTLSTGIRYFLIGLTALAWLPCIIVIFLGYWITYPLRPKCKPYVPERKRSFFEDFKAMVTDKLPCYPKKQSRIHISIGKAKKIKTGHPDKRKQYVVAHSTCRGWVMKPLLTRSGPCGMCRRSFSGHGMKTISFPKVCGKKSPPCARAAAAMRRSCSSLGQMVTPSCIPIQCRQAQPCLTQLYDQAQGFRIQMETCKRALKKKKCCSVKKPKRRKLIPKRTCWRQCVRSYKRFKTFEKECWAPGVTCGNLYVHTTRNKPCTGFLSSCPVLYPFLVNMCRLYKAITHCFLYICTACIWMPWLICCYLCVKFVCRCI